MLIETRKRKITYLRQQNNNNRLISEYIFVNNKILSNMMIDLYLSRLISLYSIFHETQKPSTKQKSFGINKVFGSISNEF